jgi:predicted Zn-dependent protease
LRSKDGKIFRHGMEVFMRRLFLTSLMLSLLIAVGASAQMRGRGRLQGNVFDKKTGKPIGAATITLAIPAGNTQPIVVKSDSKGHWAALGLTSGVWNVDISANGYLTSRGTANISEVSATPSIKTELEPEVKQEMVAAAPVGPTVPKEAVDAIKEGEQLLKLKPGDVVTNTQTSAVGTATAVSHTVTADDLKENARRAAADFEKALPMIQEDKPELREVKNQVLQVLAQAYYKAGDVKGAIETLEKLDAADPAMATSDARTVRRVLLANLYLESGQLDKGKAILENLPPAAIKDPIAYINIGILFLNKKNAVDAATYFTKAIELDPKRAESYYYRGLAKLHLKKNKEAKADLEQVVALAVDSSEAREAKQLLANLK